MKSKALIFLFLMALNFSCKSQSYVFDNLPSKQLVFGKGGGITGAVDSYTLIENGQLFYANSISKEEKELTSISKKKAKELFKKLELLKLNNQNINEPGNVYYFIEEVKKDTVSKIIWGNHDYEIATEFEAFYNNLVAILK